MSAATSRPPVAATAPASLIDLEKDRLVTVQSQCEARLGNRVSPPTIFRWTRGIGRAGKLEAVWCGQWMTTPEAFADFLRRRTAAKLGETAPADDAADDPPQERPAETAAALRQRGIKV